MADDALSRFDPFDGRINTFGVITDEVQTVAFMTEIGRYGFRLNEAPRIRFGQPTLTIVENITGGATWVELSSSQTPSSAGGEYRLDRKYDMAVVEFNATDDGKEFLVDYEGKGVVVHSNTIGAVASGEDITVAELTLTNSLISDNLQLFMDQTVMKYAGTPVLGWLTDGTAVYRRKLTGTILSSNTTLNMPHTLGAIATDNRIVGAECYFFDDTVTGSEVMRSPSDNFATGSSGERPQYFTIDDTNLQAIREPGSSLDEFEVRAFIDYIL